jgi:AcrR family transcriptional regulator
MPRPVNADAQATQRQILRSALALFSAQGMGGTSVREIARGAGVSLAMVHHYFGSKEGLYDACIAAMLAELSHLGVELRAELVTLEGSPRALFDRAVRVGFRFAREHRMSVRLLQRSIVDAGQVDARIRDGNVLPFLATISEALGGLLGRAPESLRLPIQSVIFLVVRYAISSDDELEHLVGESKKARAAEAVEDHLVEAASRLLGLPAPN